MPAPDSSRVVHDRASRVFRYLQALNQHRNPAPRQMSEQPWRLRLQSLPVHSTIQLIRCVGPGQDGGAGAESVDEDFILRVRRPVLTPPPDPPGLLGGWIRDSWTDPSKAVEVIPSRSENDGAGTPRVVPFDEDPERGRVLDAWRLLRDGWASSEHAAREVMRVFEQLYALYGRLEREGERLELVLGEGILSWRQEDGGLLHPILLQRVQLRFNPEVPEFTIRDSGRPSDLYSELFSGLESVDGRVLARCREELLQGGYSPLGGEDTSGFLRRLLAQLSAQGEFVGQGPPRPDAEPPQLGRDPVLILRNRSLGFARALDGILEEMAEREELPSALTRVVGIDASPNAADVPRPASSRAPVDVLLSKLANSEQEEIAKRLERHGCVLVQGPPGTGKTHTIANLVGHLLAQGKSVLVTSHTTKALKVLRNQVVPELQPLCVSVLESDLDSRKQLEGAVFSIAERLSSSDGAKLNAEAAQFAKHRQQLLEQLQRAREELLDALSDEYRDVVVAGKAWTPSHAARLVSEEGESHEWLPGPVTLGTSLSLTEEEVRELYRTNTSVTNRHEAELSRSLPTLDDILSPQDFETLVQRRQSLGAGKLDIHSELWPGAPQAEETTDLESLADRCLRAMSPLGGGEPWKLAVVAAGMAGESEAAPWKALVELVHRVRAEGLGSRELLLQHAPTCDEEGSIDEQMQVLADIQQHLRDGGKLGTLSLLMHPSWKRIIRSSRVESGEPQEPAHFQALAALLALRKARHTLRGRWDRQMAKLGAAEATELGDAPEEVALQLCGEIERSLGWASSVWDPLERELDRCGLRWRGLIDAEPVNLAPNGSLLRRRDAVVSQVVLALRTRANAVALARVKARLRKAVAKLDAWGGPSAPSPIVRGIVDALSARNVAAYARDFALLADVHERKQWLVRRRELLTRLESVAVGWAAAIHDRRGLHGQAVPPGDVLAAWQWRQLHDELERRGSVQLSVLQAKIESLSEDLRRCTAKLIERRAWSAQVQRTTLRQQQALVGWLDIVRRIGKGTGVRVPRLRAEAARLMNECRGAVPVWVMPLAQVVENFDSSTRFDVVIIDEASQCDAMALIALYMAKSAVVVGDHEQVSPSAVGQNLAVVQQLIDEHLVGIPNSILYDGRMSIYDLASSSFGGMVCLTEHFRCVPDIIEFSNNLSYEGRIKPLREAASARVSPALLVHRVEGHAEAKVNQAEARAVASLVVAAVSNPAYAGRTFGVISLVGEEQAIEVEQLLREHLDPTEYERRRILCGNAAQFQGDERDVMFLSMVDSPREGGPLTLRATQEFKQRFNVAVSRARDQLWVVHSLNPSIDLKPDDLRRRLLEHCSNPHGAEQAFLRAEVTTESPFEREVLARLIRAGFRVTPQWRVGHYRIDLVVEGAGRRLAVECDGDRFHPIEKLPEDMARQAILERLGWRFVRIRGSAFFRNPEAAMRPVFARLAELEIPPEGSGSEAKAEVLSDDSLRSSLVRRADSLVREWGAQKERAGRDNKDLRRVVQGERALQKRPRTVLAASNSMEGDVATGASPHAKGQQQGPPRYARAEKVEVPLPVSLEPGQMLVTRSEKSRSTDDPLRAAVRSQLPQDSFKCPTCRGERQLWVGEKGLFLKCKATQCMAKSEVITLDVIIRALGHLRAPCSCQARVQATNGPNGYPVLSCSDTTSCRKSWPWKTYRDWLRDRSLH